MKKIIISIFIILLIFFIGCGGSSNNISNPNQINCISVSKGVFIYQDIYRQDNPNKLVQDILTENFSFVIINYDKYDGNVPIEHQDEIIQLLIENNVKVYIGLDQQYRVYWEDQNYFCNNEWVQHQFEHIDWIYTKFGNSIAGVYIAEETNLCNIFKCYTEYVNKIVDYARQYEYQVVISPFVKDCSQPKPEFVQWNVDYIFVQDGVGVGTRTIEEAEQLYTYLSYYSDKIFPNVESFVGIYNIQPTTKERLIQQIENETSSYCMYVIYNLDTYVKTVKGN